MNIYQRLTHSLTVGALLIAALAARADLTVTVTPGYQFSPLENPTTETLNELGLPTISISGTIGGGTNSGIAPASITGIEMVDAFPDGGNLNLPTGRQTMGWNGANPRQLSVNTAGCVDGLQGIISTDTNAFGLLLDPAFLLLSTNSLGSTNWSNGNTGSATTNWVTLRPHSFTDLNVAPGGLTSASITNAGLAPFSLNEAQIYTNIWAVSGGFVTNTTTNFNTVIVGNTNGLGITAQLGPGLVISNVLTIIPTNVAAVTYYVTNLVPTLEVPAFNGSLPLAVNVAPWTNAVPLPAGNTNWTGTNSVFSAYEAGGLGPYTNYWGWALAANGGNGGGYTSIHGYMTNSAGNGTNSANAIFVGQFTTSNSGVWAWITVTDLVFDATGQRAVTPLVVYLGFHTP